MAYTLQRMADKLWSRLLAAGAYPHEDFFSPDIMLECLNEAQRYVCKELRIQAVREIETAKSSQALDSSGAVNLTTLNPLPLEGESGILTVRLHGGKFCRKLTDEKRREEEEAGTVYSTGDPVFYFEGEKLYIRPCDGQTVDLVYKKQPVEMAFSDTQGVADTSCALKDSLQDLVITKAVAVGLAWNGQLAEASVYDQETDNAIKRLNARTIQIEPARLEVGRMRRGC